MSKLIVYHLGVGDIFSRKAVRVMKDASAVNSLVEGTIEEVPLTDELFIVTSYEMNMLRTIANRVLLNDGEFSRIIFGDAVVIRKNADGEYVHIKDSDVDIIESALRPIFMYSHTGVSYFKEDMKGITTYEFKKS